MADTISLIFSWIDSIQMILLYGWPFILLIIIFALKIKWRNWPLEAIIIERRGNNLIKTNDRIGKYLDPYTKIVGYKLQKAMDIIPIVNFDWIIHNVAVHTTLFERFINLLRGNVGTIFLFKYGTKQYKPIWIKFNQTRKLIYKEIKSPQGNPILITIYEQFDPRKHLGALEFEVIDWDNMNFMVQEQRSSFERRQKKSSFMKEIVIPITIMVVCAMVCIIMIKFSYDYAMAMRGSAPASAPAKQPNIPIVNELIPAS
jgi:hypothetical protein